jgi:hypothetical protein
MTVGWLLLYALALYAALGVLAGIVFVASGVSRVFEHRPPVSVGARLLLLPASIAFWPLILRRWAIARATP